MQAGDVFTDKNLRIIRPGMGLDPKFYDILIGRNVYHDVKKGDPVDWEMLGTQNCS